MERKRSNEYTYHQRFLHMKGVLYRTVDAINTLKMKEDLANNVSKFQIGSIPEHACEEHVLTIKTILANKELINEGLIFFRADIK